jgi:hypothetical protein
MHDSIKMWECQKSGTDFCVWCLLVQHTLQPACFLLCFAFWVSSLSITFLRSRLVGWYLMHSFYFLTTFFQLSWLSVILRNTFNIMTQCTVTNIQSWKQTLAHSMCNALLFSILYFTLRHSPQGWRLTHWWSEGSSFYLALFSLMDIHCCF